MVRTKKIFREDLIQGAYSLILDQGFEQFNARNVAQRVPCSTQPIYREFESLITLRQAIYDYVIQRIDIFLFEYNTKNIAELVTAVIRYAAKYPREFHRFFIEDSDCSQKIRQHFQTLFLRAILENQQQLQREELTNHFKLFWFYTLGKASFCSYQPRYTDAHEETLLHLLQTAN